MYMKDWIKKLNDILTINERQILEHTGKVTRQLAEEIAASQYDKFRQKQQDMEKADSLRQLEIDLKKIESGKKKK